MPQQPQARYNPPTDATTLRPDAHVMRLAAEARALLDRLAQVNSDVILSVTDQQGSKAEARIPAPVLQFLLSALAEVANGSTVSMLPLNTELTTQQAAELLNLSRPHLVRLLEQGCLPFRKVGNQRRVPLQDVLAYKARGDASRRAALDELARQAQELGLGYDE